MPAWDREQRRQREQAQAAARRAGPRVLRRERDGAQAGRATDDFGHVGDATFIGPYRVLAHIGSGAFASVYRVWDPALQRTLALKILADNWSHHADIRRRFQQEARILAAIDHPHVVRVYTTATLPNGRPYFVMDDADRGTLAERLDAWRAAGTRPTLVEALRISLDIGAGLRAVHAHGVIVRDLKPGNILFRSLPAPPRGATAGHAGPERLLLSDFGVARLMDAATRSTIVAGTPHYMAPEQADPSTAGSVDARVDIYAAAVLLYELLSGTVPWPFASHAEVLHAQAQATAPPDISERLPADVSLPDDLRAHIMAALQRDPNARPADAAAWLAGLQSALAEITPAPTTPDADNATDTATPYAAAAGVATTPPATDNATPQRYSSSDAGAADRARQRTERTQRRSTTADPAPPDAINPDNSLPAHDAHTTTSRTRARRQRRLQLTALALLIVVIIGAVAILASGALDDNRATPTTAALRPTAAAFAPTATATGTATVPASAPLTRAQTRAVTRFAAIDASCQPAAAVAGEAIGQIRCQRDGFVLFFIAYPDGPTANAYAAYYRATFQPRETAWAANGQQGNVLRFRDGESDIAYLTSASEGFGIWVAASDGDATALDAWLDPAALMRRP